jgi:hypothetical protein
VYGNNYPRPRSPSPLRSGFKVDPYTGEIESEDGSDDNDDDPDTAWGRRSQSPNPSISKFASTFAQRVGSFVGVASATSPSLPTDEELEREAERERDRSRREAERILTREAEERRLMEEKVLAMLHVTPNSPKHDDGSPARSQSMPALEPAFEHPSPTLSQSESGGMSSWWTAAKNRLTPTKEPLTAAQQVIQEAKDKEKREKKEAKKTEKDRKRSADWPTTPENKFNNPTLLSLATPPKPSPNYTSQSAPSSPTPSIHPPSLLPGPLRLLEGPTVSPARSTSRSPSREPPPLYAQFKEEGTLDMPGTLLVIARRFEKLEKWTVGHVRALEDRMSDVERWLVEKENDKEGENGAVSKASEPTVLEESVNEMRDELVEVQGRIGELGREVAKLVTAPAVLSSLPSRVSAQAVSTAPQTNSSFAIHAQTSSSITVHSHSLPPNTPQSSVSPASSYTDLRRRESLSPPFVPSSAVRAEPPRSRLPYPTGDYTSPRSSVTLAQSSISPPQTPPTASTSASVSPAAAARPRLVPVPGLPATSPPPTTPPPSGLPRTGGTLTAPLQPARPRSSSISPTPRKRYTVALGEPIMKPRASASPPPISVGDGDTEEEGSTVDRTIGRSAGRQRQRHASVSLQPKKDTSQSSSVFGAQRRKNVVGLGLANGTATGGDDTDTSADSVPASPPRRNTRTRGSAQTMLPAPTTTTSTVRLTTTTSTTSPLRVRTPSTTDRNTAPEDEQDPLRRTSWSSSTSGRFRDPLVVRREVNEARAKATPRPPKVVAGKPRAPVGELVAYFDKT